VAMITTDERLDAVTKSLGDLATVVRDMAVHVYKGDEAYGEEEEYEAPIEEAPAEDEIAMNDPMAEAPMESPMEPGLGMEEEVDKMPEEEGMPEGEEMLPDPVADEEMASHGGMYRSRKAKVAKRKAVAKGYNNAARQKRDEEDAPFDEQQSSIKGNEASPAGRMDGGREDETFNASFMQVTKELKTIREALGSAGITVARSVVPPVGTVSKGRNAEPVMTRDLEAEVKTRSWKELNKLREDVGDLPRNAFGG
jgi:hypothetical protein